MRIVCPSCQAAYEVPDKLMSGPPRRVRCAKCGGHWTPEPEPAAAPPPPPEPAALPPPAHEPEPEPEPDPLPPTPPPPKPMPRLEQRLAPEPAPAPGRMLLVVAVLGWIASLGAVGALGWAAVTFRADVMAAWAPSRRLFAWLGLG